MKTTYHCPDCAKALLEKESRYGCESCGKDFEGLGKGALFAEPDRPEPMASFCAEVLSRGWKKALASRTGGASASMSRSCADWRFFIPFGQDASILEIGSGAGELALLLAGNAGELHTVSFSVSTARITAKRAAEQGLGNVFPAALTPGKRFPFAEEAFDAVVADRILNHPALYFPGRPGIREGGSFLLSEAHRLLKKGGVLYVGVENHLFRWPLLKRIFGLFRRSGPEEDANFNFNLQAAGLERNRGRYLSFSGYRELILAAGFSALRIYSPLPDPIRTKVTIPLESAVIQKYFFMNLIRRNSLKARLASRLGAAAAEAGVLPQVIPYYYYIAEK